LKSKDKAPSKIIEYVRLAKRQTGLKVKAVQSDNGTEYNKTLDSFFKTRVFSVGYPPLTLHNRMASLTARIKHWSNQQDACSLKLISRISSGLKPSQRRITFATDASLKA